MRQWGPLSGVMKDTKLPAVVIAAMLVTTAFAAIPVAADGESVAVETQYADEVTDDSATLHGNLTALANASNATVWFEYWEEDDPANSSETERLSRSEVGPFHGYPDDLESNTTYVFVAHASTGNASAVGIEDSFTTEPAMHVEVETGDASGVTNDSATLAGELTVLRSDEDATVWFEYWAADDPDNSSTTAAQELDEPGAFSAAADGLDSETDYVFVAHAASANLSASGDEVGFATVAEALPLGVETDEASDVEDGSATLNGELTGLGGEDTATVWFEYWVEDAPEESDTTGEATLDEPGAFDATVDDLENDTTYVYVAHARVGDDEVTGDEVEFTTDESASAAPSRGGEGPFGQWLTSWLKNLVPQDSDVPFGQKVAELVRDNNPGADKRSDGANPGGNGNGPPDHAGPKDTADDDNLESQDDGDDEDDDGESS